MRPLQFVHVVVQPGSDTAMSVIRSARTKKWLHPVGRGRGRMVVGTAPHTPRNDGCGAKRFQCRNQDVNMCLANTSHRFSRTRAVVPLSRGGEADQAIHVTRDKAHRSSDANHLSSYLQHLHSMGSCL